MEAVPDLGGLPVAQAAPTGDAGSAAHFLGQHLPRNAALEDEDDAGQGDSDGSSGSTIAQSSAGTRSFFITKVYHSITRF